MKNSKALGIYLYIVLFVFESGMRIPMFKFLSGDVKIVFAIILLLIGAFLVDNFKKKVPYVIGYFVFKWLIIALGLSVLMAYFFWHQDLTTSILLYRHHVWILFLPLLFYLQPSEHVINNVFLAFALTVAFVWCGNVLGFITPEYHVTYSGEIIEEPDVFGGYGIPGERMITFIFYFFLSYLVSEFTLRNICKTLLAFILVLFTTQRALIFGVVPIMIYVILFKLQMKTSLRIVINFSFVIFLSVFFIQTIDIWTSFFEETSSQLSDEDYNRWKALDFFLHHYGTGWGTLIFGNGFLSLHNQGGQLLYNLGAEGIFIDDIGMIGVWVKYGIIPIILLYYIIIKVFRYSVMPIYMKCICAHIGLLPVSWTLVGPHYTVFIFIIYLYCYHRYKINNDKKVRVSVTS